MHRQQERRRGSPSSSSSVGADVDLLAHDRNRAHDDEASTAAVIAAEALCGDLLPARREAQQQHVRGDVAVLGHQRPHAEEGHPHQHDLGQLQRPVARGVAEVALR